jgi:murein DD-endopeptidase MepM/ murein hydrolase activator NlpD
MPPNLTQRRPWFREHRTLVYVFLAGYLTILTVLYSRRSAPLDDTHPQTSPAASILNSVAGTIEEVPGADPAHAAYTRQLRDILAPAGVELHPGERFRLVTRADTIEAAELVADGATLRFVRYVNHLGAGYYTLDGRPLTRTWLPAPIQSPQISSSYGWRHDPWWQRAAPHRGVDYAARIGTPVQAVGQGRVIFRGPNGSYGNVVVIAHPRGMESVYGHLGVIPTALRVGNRVRQGETIGYVGRTGLATGPHLHFEVRQDGKPVDPNTALRSEPDRIPDALMPDFRRRATLAWAALGSPAATTRP